LDSARPDDDALDHSDPVDLWQELSLDPPILAVIGERGGGFGAAVAWALVWAREWVWWRVVGVGER
jgi:hypothetical protein